MTQPVERRQIALTTDGQPIFVPRQVGPGESQPVGELADGQPVWPLPSGGPTYSGTAPFGLLSSGQPVWAEQVKASKPFYRKKRVLIPAAVLAVALVGGLGGGDQASDTVETGGSAASEQKAEQTPEEAAAEKAAADKAAADKAAAEKAAADKAAADKAAADKAAADKAAADAAARGTVSQQNALGSAENYLDLTAFSKSGLARQLEQGDGFSAADAAWAVERVDADWNEQAAKSAKNYLELTTFSRSGLVNQLVQGDGFTPEQAEYGVAQTGL